MLEFLNLPILESKSCLPLIVSQFEILWVDFVPADITPLPIVVLRYEPGPSSVAVYFEDQLVREDGRISRRDRDLMFGSWGRYGVRSSDQQATSRSRHDATNTPRGRQFLRCGAHHQGPEEGACRQPGCHSRRW